MDSSSSSRAPSLGTLPRRPARRSHPPATARAVAHLEQAAAIEACEFTPLAQGIAVQRHFNPAFGKPCDEARVGELAGDLAAKMAGYERLLTKSRYLASDEVTLADLLHLAYGVHLAPHGFKFLKDEEKFPHVARCVRPIVAEPRAYWSCAGGGRISRPARRGKTCRNGGIGSERVRRKSDSMRHPSRHLCQLEHAHSRITFELKRLYPQILHLDVYPAQVIISSGTSLFLSRQVTV
jgi:hypothetical protein